MLRFMRTTAVFHIGVGFVLCAASPVRAGPSDTVEITTEGRAAGTNANAMEQAKQDALRKAVEQACGTFINAQTRTKNYAAVYDKVLSQAAGYVTEFELLDQRFDGNISYCKVRAKVSKRSFELDWAAFAHTVESEENPRCVVVVIEDNDAEDRNPPKAAGVVQSILERFFMDKGLQLMDQGASRDARTRDMELAALNDDVNKLAAMCASFKADVVISGKAEARRAGTSELAGRTIYKWSATLSIRAFHADSAQLVMSNTYTATATTVNGGAWGDEALKKSAEDNAATILRDIGEAWRKRQNVRRTLQVTFENCGRADYKAFEEAARQIDGVQSVRMRELVNNVCQVEIDWAYDLERLVSRIEGMKVPGASYSVTEQTHDRVTFKIKK